MNDRYLQDAAYIRVKAALLNYRVPQDVVDLIGLASLNLYYSSPKSLEATNMRPPLDPSKTNSYSGILQE